jgi:hypothetical protein
MPYIEGFATAVPKADKAVCINLLPPSSSPSPASPPPS